MQKGEKGTNNIQVGKERTITAPLLPSEKCSSRAQLAYYSFLSLRPKVTQRLFVFRAENVTIKSCITNIIWVKITQILSVLFFRFFWSGTVASFQRPKRFVHILFLDPETSEIERLSVKNITPLIRPNARGLIFRVSRHTSRGTRRLRACADRAQNASKHA